MGGAGGDDEVIILHVALAEEEPPFLDVDPRDFAENDLTICLVAEDGANWRADVSGGQCGGGDLVEQGLEDVVVAPINDGQFDIRALQRASGAQPGKASANNENTRQYFLRHTSDHIALGNESELFRKPRSFCKSPKERMICRRGRCGRRENRGARAGKRERISTSKKAIFIGGAIVLLVVLGGVLFWLHARNYVSTDDAYTTGHVHQISARISGTVSAVMVNDNQHVQRNSGRLVEDAFNVCRQNGAVRRERRELRRAAGGSTFLPALVGDAYPVISGIYRCPRPP
jgi:hypothetical protein